MHEAHVRPDPPLALLLRPKWLTARTRAMANERGRGARFGLLGLMGLLFWAFIYIMLFRLLRYFRGVQEIGPLLAGTLRLAGKFEALSLITIALPCGIVPNVTGNRTECESVIFPNQDATMPAACIAFTTAGCWLLANGW